MEALEEARAKRDEQDEEDTFELSVNRRITFLPTPRRSASYMKIILEERKEKARK